MKFLGEKMNPNYRTTFEPYMHCPAESVEEEMKCLYYKPSKTSFCAHCEDGCSDICDKTE